MRIFLPLVGKDEYLLMNCRALTLKKRIILNNLKKEQRINSRFTVKGTR